MKQFLSVVGHYIVLLEYIYRGMQSFGHLFQNFCSFEQLQIEDEMISLRRNRWHKKHFIFIFYIFIRA